MRMFAGTVFLLLSTLGATAQQIAEGHAPTSAAVTFTYQNTKLSPPEYKVFLREDGTGRFTSTEGNGTPVQQEISITPEVTATIFSIARQQKYFDVVCQAKGTDRMAYQGTKMLEYAGPDGQGSCKFNYSKIKQIEQLSDSFQSATSTIGSGHRLAAELQHDRLGLDREMEALVAAAADGRATQLQNIRPILQEIAADPGVINRARQRAAMLAAGRTH